jgi:hypothetical protein
LYFSYPTPQYFAFQFYDDDPEAVSGKVLILMGTEKDATGMFSGLKLEPDGLKKSHLEMGPTETRPA